MAARRASMLLILESAQTDVESNIVESLTANVLFFIFLCP